MKNITKNFEKIKTIEFSQAIKINNKELYLVYNLTVNSLNLDKNSIINGEYDPIAYLYIENDDEIYIGLLNEKYTNYLKNNENKEKIIKKFKENKLNLNV